MMDRVEIVLELKNITKKFGDFIANDNINLKVGRGEIHALLGENGAGKSTLVNTVFGMHQPDGGEISVYEQPTIIKDPSHAIRLGIGMVHQHFQLVENFTVTENIILGVEPTKGKKIDMQAANKEVAEISARYGLQVDPKEKIGNISVGVQQKVEILKSLYRGANILIFDEPTAVLTPDEINELKIIMRKLVEEGKSIILITHKLNEIMTVADKCTVIRRGKHIGTVNVKDSSEDELARLMVGKNVSKNIKKDAFNPGDTVLEIEHLNLETKTGKKTLDDINLKVRSGEILGIAGVDGNGQSQLVESIVKMIEPSSGDIKIKGTDIKNKDTRDIYELGVSYVPADRHKHGLVLGKTIADNLILIDYYKDKYNEGIKMKKNFIQDEAKKSIDSYDIRAGNERSLVKDLSGGNQQKIILAREISRNPDLLVIVQPTRGLDVGAINYIHNQIIKLRDQGVAILLVSFELEELLTLSDNINIIFDGKIIGKVDPTNTNDTELGLMMAGKGDQG